MCANENGLNLTEDIIQIVLAEYKYHPPKETSKNVKINNITSDGYSYLLETRESIRCNDCVYKIGRSREIYRPTNYPKGTVLIRQTMVTDQFKVERELKERFKKEFKQIFLYGTEYFSGDINKIKVLWDEIVDKYNPSITKERKIRIKLRYK